jgi:hypothetical protein
MKIEWRRSPESDPGFTSDDGMNVFYLACSGVAAGTGHWDIAAVILALGCFFMLWSKQ